MARTVEIHEHALDQIRYIRQAMERTSEFTAVPGWGGVAMGVSALVVATMATRQPDIRTWFHWWGYECLFGMLIGGFSVWRKVRAGDESIYTSAGRKFLLSFAPPITAGALISYVLYIAQVPGLMPGVWLLLYGTAVVAAGTFSVKIVPLMGFSFMSLGAVALFVPFFWANVLLAIGFGGLHIIFGAWIARRFGG